MTQRPRVLVIARNYPNNVLPALGLWTRRQVVAASEFADPTVLAPVPYAPPLLPFAALAQFRQVVTERRDTGLHGDYAVFHPRVPLAPGYALHRFEARFAWPFLRHQAERLRTAQRFDLIHAHFIYPEGVLAARLGRLWDVPVITTEQAAWRPWLDQEPAVRRQVVRALPFIRLVLPVSRWMQRNMEETVGSELRSYVIPNVVDEVTFTPATGQRTWNPDQILFVGLIRHVKGLDLLVRAFALLVEQRPSLRLLVIGGAFYRSYQRDEIRVRRLVEELGLTETVRFAGEKSPADVAAAMRESALLAIPSRRESFSAVCAEAIASGTPVVATRCGGPEDIITPDSGLLVPLEDPAALATGIQAVLRRRASYNSVAMHQDMVDRFGTATIGRRLAEVYAEVLREGSGDTTAQSS